MSRLARWRPRAPQSLASRFALLLVVALVSANVAAVLLLSTDRARTERSVRDARVFDRLLDIVEIVTETPAAERAGVARVLSTRATRVALAPEPRARAARGRLARLARRMEAALALPAGSVRLSGRRARNGDGPPPRGWRRNRGRVFVSVPLEDGTWLNVAQRFERRRPGPGLWPLFVVLGLSLAATLLVGLRFVRRLTTPMRRLEAAARRAGRGDRSARVPETGARELRELAAAFNEMQERIARFDAERIRLVAAVGHDLRTPITSLRIRAEMLDEEVREPMVRTLDEMAVMADGLLAFARGEAGEISAPLDLAALVEEVCSEASVPFTAPGPAMVEGRKVALRRIVSNLLTNAERYAGGGSVRMERRGPQVAVHVEDRGPGIAPERLEEMMEPFARLDPSRSGDTGGAGLGLSIARSLARSHGGELTLSPREGGGLMATLTLPLSEEGAAPRR